MMLFAGRPSRTHLDVDPVAWYLYRWDMATTPAFVEFWEADSLVFLLAHLAALVAVGWVAWRAVRRRQRAWVADAEPGVAEDRRGTTDSPEG